MSGSALIGHPPNTQNDWYIIRGLARWQQIPDELFDPSKGSPLPLKRPPNSHYASRGPGIIAAAAVTKFLVILITGSRLGLRFFRRDLKVGIDDYVIIPAALLTVAFLAIAISMVLYGGAGKHIYDLTYAELNWLRQAGLLDIPIFWMSAGLTKVSIIFFNRRLTGLTSRRWMMVHHIFLALTIGFMIAALFSELFQCPGPVTLKFSLLEKGRYPTNFGECVDGNKLGYGLAIVHSFLDFCLLCIPIVILYKMKLTASKKLRLGFLFSVGLVSCIGSVMRQVHQEQIYHDPDASWVYERVLTWIIMDLFFGITAASLPVLNALVPKNWKSSGNPTPQLSHFSIFNSKSEATQSDKQETSDNGQRPDGTARDAGDPTDVEKDSFHKRTEKRWDEAFVGVQRPKAAQNGDTSVGLKRSDDTLV